MSLAIQKSIHTHTIMLGAGAVLAVGFRFIRNQTAVSDRQFLRSMIPHHAAAILMCGRATLEDAEIKKLYESIISGQTAEISLMRRKLQERQ
jgi:uncharacterized protein (DUF305 family)